MVSCDGCGACCLGLGVPPLDEFKDGVDREDIEYQLLPDVLKAEIDAAWAAGVESFAEKPCIWFDSESRRCKHYEWRPAVCASFEPGNPFCVEIREAAEARKET